MRKYRSAYVFPACAVVALSLGATALAQNSRSYVSQSGSDSNSCTLTSTCRGIARAMQVTNDGGEIILLDSGSYGAPFTITKSIIINAAGIVASMTTQAAGASHITVNTTENVTLIGLTLHGIGHGANGILVQQVGVLRLYNIFADGYTNDGVDFTATGNLAIYNSEFNDNTANGLAVTNGSAYVQNTGFDHNNDGVFVGGGNVTVANSWSHYNLNGFESSGGNLVLTDSYAILNSTGLLTSSAGGSIDFVRCVVAENSTYAFNRFSGSTLSGSNPGTSVILGNTNGSLGGANGLN